MTDFTNARLAKCEVCGMLFCIEEGLLCDCHCPECGKAWEICECDEKNDGEE